MSQHLVLLGDSIFDNAGYVPGGRPAVIDQVRNRLSHGWVTTLLARDGSMIDDVHRHLKALPADATHLVLSVGGNDVLAQIAILRERVTTVADALRLLLESRTQFQEEYLRLMEAIRDRGLPTAVCTIYNPCSDDDDFQRAAVAASACTTTRSSTAAAASGSRSSICASSVRRSPTMRTRSSPRRPAARRSPRRSARL